MMFLVSLLQIYSPEFVKKKIIMQLFESTAEAFEVEVPPIAGARSGECLAMYARFTRDRAEEQLQNEHGIDSIKERLYRNAFEMGRQSRRLFQPGSVQEVMDVGRLLYSVLDTDFEGDAQGEVVIGRCYFSRLYSPEVCRLLSAMDNGLLAGLANGGEFVFDSRITEGQSCCRAHFSMASNAANHQVAES